MLIDPNVTKEKFLKLSKSCILCWGNALPSNGIISGLLSGQPGTNKVNVQVNSCSNFALSRSPPETSVVASWHLL